jgi:hypothetical protein
MRLPVIYETTASSTALPSFVDGVTPTYAGSDNGVPASSWTWTASAYGNVDYPETYIRWSGTSNFNAGYTGSLPVICVLPSN